MAINPSFLTTGGEWRVGTLGSPEALPGSGPAATGPAGTGPGGSFGHALAGAIGKLDNLQAQAGQASQALATGQAADPSQVVMAVERAQLAMQLASQVRTKAVEALTDVFHTQV